jgi:16S rRNA (uracil1498-N3)-methyltransferase
MKIPRFYEDQALQVGAELELGPDAAAHVGRVLRMKADEHIVLFNGKGGEYKAVLREVAKKKVRVELLECREENRQSALLVHLGQVLSKGPRMDFVIQKATELGVHRITPLFSERSEVRLGTERTAKRLTHWRKVAISACEQSGRNLLPEIATPLDVPHWMDEVEADAKWILHGSGESTLHCDRDVSSCAVAVGPEGGFSDSEITRAKQAGFLVTRLGPRTLRTESAPLAALSILQYLHGDLGGNIG